MAWVSTSAKRGPRKLPPILAVMREFAASIRTEDPDLRTLGGQMLFHIAVVAPDAKAVRARLEKAGAKLFLEQPQPDGSLLIMMRDPWGVALQLCQRTKPFPMP